MSEVIDVHTHMYTRGWVERLRTAKDPNVYLYRPDKIHEGRPKDVDMVNIGGKDIAPLAEKMFDWEGRIRDMNKAGVDLAIVSLSAPGVLWGGRETSVTTAREVNDDMAAAQVQYPDRVRWMATLPWQYPEDAVAELKRAEGMGAVAVFVTTNIMGERLTDPRFYPIWAEIEGLGLPVLVHPTPPLSDTFDLDGFKMTNTIGFTAQTTLALLRMIYEGFLDRFPKLKLIASHGGGTLPYLAGRFDRAYDLLVETNDVVIKEPPSTYLTRIWYDSVVYSPGALDLCISVGGDERVLYGSDFPFDIGDMEGCLSRVDVLPKRLRDGIRSRNTMKIFRL